MDTWISVNILWSLRPLNNRVWGNMYQNLFMMETFPSLWGHHLLMRESKIKTIEKLAGPMKKYRKEVCAVWVPYNFHRTCF